MVMSFDNKFFSLAGQKERLANAGNTLLSAVGIKKGGVQSNTNVKILDTVLSVTASHPFLTAGAIAGAINPSGALSAGKAGIVGAGKAFSSATLGQKTAIVVSAPIIAGAVSSNPALIGKAVEAPGALANFGSNVGTLSKNPTIENLGKIAKENPIISGLAVGTGLLAIGSAGRGVAGIIATAQNTSAVRESTQAGAMVASAVPLVSAPKSSSPVGSPSLVAPVADSSITPRRATSGSTRRRRRKVPVKPSINNNVKIYNIDDRDNNDRKVYKRSN